jgi:tetratricopeptide (TPR) repeat protein
MPAKASQKKKFGLENELQVAAAGSSQKLSYWAVPSSIALVTFVAFLPSLQNGFVNWDDESFLLANRHYRGLGWTQLRWMFTTCHLSSCMPLTWVTYGLDYVFWGLNPLGYHLTSILIHAANAALFYLLSLRLLRLAVSSPAVSSQLPIRLAAGFSAFFFSLHPLRVGAVTWIVGREMVVAGFFFFLTLLCYLRAAENESLRWRWMNACWLLYALSLLGKEAALTLPLALIVLDIYPLRRLGGGQGKWFGSQVRSVWWEKLPFLLLALAAGMRAVLGKEGTGALYSVASYGLAPRSAQVLYSLAFYPWKTVFPVGLSPLYPVQPFTGFSNLPLLLSGALVLCLTVGFFISRHRWPAGLAAWAFYGFLLIPVSGIVAFGPYRAADHFSYLPCLSWALLTGAALLWCWRLWVSGHLSMRTLVLTESLAVLLLVVLGVLTWNQTQVWKDSERLWRHALALEERSSFAHNNLGLVLAERGALEEAIKEFRRAVEIDPAFVEAHTNLGHFLALQGSRREAIAHLRQALEVDPAFANAHNTLGNVLADAGELDDAIEHFRTVLQKDPQSAMAHYNLARVLAKRGNVEEAMAHYRMALTINPADADIHNNLGLLLQSRGSLDEAIGQFREALRVNPKYAKGYFNLGKAVMQQERHDEAVHYFQQALRIQPGVAEIHENLARALARQGKKEQAVQQYEEAIRLSKSRFKDSGIR